MPFVRECRARNLEEALGYGTKKVSAGGAVCPDGDFSRVYVVLPSHKYGPWDFPKGRLDQGENLKQTAVREIWEECGLKAKVLSGNSAYLGTGAPHDEFNIVTHIFLMSALGGTPHPTYEVEKVSLVTWDEAIALFSSSVHGYSPNKRAARQAEKAKLILKEHYGWEE